MKIKTLMCVLAVGVSGIAIESAMAEEAHSGHKMSEMKLKVQETCPVMGGKINKKLFVDKDGKRIYVCCAGCIAPIKKDFAKFEKKLMEKGQKPHAAVKAKMKHSSDKGTDHSGHKH